MSENNGNQPGGGNDFTGDGKVTWDDFERTSDWVAWNEESKNSLNYWNNKYDRGVCVQPQVPPITGSPITGNPPEPEPYFSPKIERLSIIPCTTVKLFILGGRDVQ
jgi:hypothetical protein